MKLTVMVLNNILHILCVTFIVADRILPCDVAIYSGAGSSLCRSD